MNQAPCAPRKRSSRCWRRFRSGSGRALEAVKIRGLSVAEAASESGQSVAALKVNVHRAVKALRSLVAAGKDGAD